MDSNSSIFATPTNKKVKKKKEKMTSVVLERKRNSTFYSRSNALKFAGKL
jgi:hypothetical protein